MNFQHHSKGFCGVFLRLDLATSTECVLYCFLDLGQGWCFTGQRQIDEVIFLGEAYH